VQDDYTAAAKGVGVEHRMQQALRRKVIWALAVLGVLLVNGCGGGKPSVSPGWEPGAIFDELSIVSVADLNACDSTGSHSVAMRLYLLESTEKFRAATFSDLWRKPEALGLDNSSILPHTIRPSNVTTVTIPRGPRVTHLGIVVDFCQHEGDCWKKIVPLAKESTTIRLDLSQTCATVTVE
jgi:type VI secretion system VasD/TssJ family lipoprotein